MTEKSKKKKNIYKMVGKVGKGIKKSGGLLLLSEVPFY